MADGWQVSRRVRVLLVLSLALNLAVAGVVIGAVVRDGPRGGGPRIDMTLGPLGRALSPEDRRAVVRDLRQSGALGGMDRTARRQALEETVALLRAEPFEPEALARGFAAQRERGGRLLEAGHGALVARIAAMTPQERAALADRLEAETRQGPTGGARTGG
ncbi:periplasmic heavy metal sensor [Histidinibacterium lentulum]|uniref:Periplasmic heavy metal sensor n=1 Tax=Histidinibacterium lentulum TaxID=2480588 RepID=A0A3N2QKZ6_9RHOB|nr:periplasmic heavy metal sensor [Histidinibacterium lentulum]ROT95869.1 periplasmic heavy metal sensor [Histidinibacterium lentulum]